MVPRASAIFAIELARGASCRDAGAKRSFREAIALDPSEPLSRIEYCNFLMTIGQRWRAQAQVDAVYHLAPANTP